ncbi:MAG: hypothetical protein AAFZ11_03225 [Pseudomonadota bacterium]
MLLIDEVIGEGAQEIGQVPTSKPTISVRELLNIRIELEWQAFADKHDTSQEVVDLSKAPESRLNAASKLARSAMFKPSQDGVDRKLESMFKVAEEAFLENRIFVLLDDRQAESLDELVEVDRTAAATFLLLTPLQGG